MLSNRRLKDHVRTAKNCQILYAKFHVLFKNIQRKIATKFLSTLLLSPALENCICAKPIQRYLNMLQSHSIGCSLANRDTKDPIVMQNALNSEERSIRLLTVSHKQNPKSVFKYSLGQQSNVATTLSRALPQRYLADFEHVQT